MGGQRWGGSTVVLCKEVLAMGGKSLRMPTSPPVASMSQRVVRLAVSALRQSLTASSQGWKGATASMKDTSNSCSTRGRRSHRPTRLREPGRKH